MRSYLWAFCLNPKTPAEVNRFTPVNSVQIKGDTELSSIITRPQGTLISHHDVVVSKQNVTERHIAVADYILNQRGYSKADLSVTIFIEISEQEHRADYYVVVHNSRTITWVANQEPESFKQANGETHAHEY